MTTSTNPFDFDQRPPNQVAEYDTTVTRFMPGYTSVFQMALALLEMQLSEAANLLVVGAGSGMELVTFGQAKPNWHLLGVDPSTLMLAIAQQKLIANQLTDRVTLHQGYVHELPEQPLYDAATCILVMHFLPDDGSKLAFLRSISDRLKPGAMFLLVDGFGDKASASFRMMLEAWKRHGLNAGADVERLTEMEQKIRESLPCIPESRTVALLEEAGFEQVTRFYASLIYGGWVATKTR
jgi:tRNA (cmo5U34)-methyltransferase